MLKNTQNNVEKDKWCQVVDLLKSGDWSTSEDYINKFILNPQLMTHELAYYKFAYRMIPKKSKILELNSRSSIGFNILTEDAVEYLSVSEDNDFNQEMRTNSPGNEQRFIHSNDFETGAYKGKFDAIVYFCDEARTNFDDVLDLIVKVCLKKRGLFFLRIESIKNIESTSAVDLVKKLKKYFKVVIPFCNRDGSIQVSSRLNPNSSLFMSCSLSGKEVEV